MRHEKQTTDVLYVQDCYLRLLRKEDAAMYYEKGFAQEDEEVRRSRRVNWGSCFK